MNPSKQIRILSVDDHPMLREGLAAVLSTETDLALVAEASNGRYLLKNMVRKELIETIRSVYAGKRRIPAEIAVEIAEHHSDDDLTESSYSSAQLQLRTYCSGMALTPDTERGI